MQKGIYSTIYSEIFMQRKALGIYANRKQFVVYLEFFIFDGHQNDINNIILFPISIKMFHFADKLDIIEINTYRI